MTQTKAKTVIERGYCPVLTVKGRDEVRLAAFVSLAGKIVLGPWSKAPPPPPTPGLEAAGLRRRAAGRRRPRTTSSTCPVPRT